MKYDFTEYDKFLEEVKKLYKNIRAENYDFTSPSCPNRETMTRTNITVIFDNGWGIDIFFGQGSFGAEKGLLELAVLRGFDFDEYSLHYDNPVAEGDVRGYLTADEALELTKEVASWKKDAIFPEWEDENGHD